MKRGWMVMMVMSFILAALWANARNTKAQVDDCIHFAAIGDYGVNLQSASAVANLVHSWNADFVITVGDNNYPDGAAATIDVNIGQYYHDFIYPYIGGYGNGADSNQFFPSLGNHDWNTAGAQPYLDYFTLPGNERYYEFVQWPVHFFALDSDDHEPDGATNNSVQGQWLQAELATSTTPWQVVYMHHAPYSSGGTHGSIERMQWPYKAWGADIVLAGHDHIYERLTIDDFTYFVNGLGGRELDPLNSPIEGSEIQYNQDYGAMLVDACSDLMTFQFINQAGEVIDSYTQKLYKIWLPMISGT